MQITHSKDGVEIPEEGLPFEVVTGPEGEQTTTVLVLHDLLAGLNCKVNPDKTQSQAQSFASFAVQSGFLDEDSILAKYRYAAPREVDGEIQCRSWSLISTWENQIKDARAKQARQTMRDNGTEISAGQVSEAMRLIPLLKDADFGDLAATLHRLVQVNEEIEGPQGATISASIGQAHRLLNMSQPRREQGSSGSSTEHTSDSKVTDPSDAVDPTEPF